MHTFRRLIGVSLTDGLWFQHGFIYANDETPFRNWSDPAAVRDEYLPEIEALVGHFLAFPRRFSHFLAFLPRNFAVFSADFCSFRSLSCR